MVSPELQTADPDPSPSDGIRYGVPGTPELRSEAWKASSVGDLNFAEFLLGSSRIVEASQWIPGRPESLVSCLVSGRRWSHPSICSLGRSLRAN